MPPSKRILPDIHKVEIDITYACGFGCHNCNRMTVVAPGTKDQNVSPQQLQSMLDESVNCGHIWRRIRILGGEPTVHPNFEEICSILVEYREKHNHSCQLEISTHGAGEFTQKRLTWLKTVFPEFNHQNTKKTGPIQKDFAAACIAPQDMDPEWAKKHQFMGCNIPRDCGVGYNYQGFYCCAIAGAIDRIYGLGLSVKAVKELDSARLSSSYNIFCSKCGHYLPIRENSQTHLSPSWKKALELYRRKPIINDASPENTAVLVLACYPSSEVKSRVRDLQETAMRSAISLQLRGIGERYNHFHSKINRIRDFISELPERFRYILYLDARDTLLLRPLSYICEVFNQMNSPILVSAEIKPWPVRDLNWVKRFPPDARRWRWLNAGMWMGSRDPLIAALGIMSDLRLQLRLEKPSQELMDVWEWRRYAEDDQFLWQVCHLKKKFPLLLDYQCLLFANINGADYRLENNRDFGFLPDKGLIRIKFSKSEPAVLHFSGGMNKVAKEAWMKHLQLLPLNCGTI
jgi:4Fe-4S single cluster domain